MAHLIDKDALVAEIKERIKTYNKGYANGDDSRADALEVLLHDIDTLEVKEVNTWHLQEKEDIYDAIKDWDIYTFACIMKDRTIQKFRGYLSENCEGHINVHIDGVNDDYNDTDDIVKWIEYT